MEPETKKRSDQEFKVKILKNRYEVYTKAKLKNPIRWSGNTRNWSMIEEVKLNPGKGQKLNDEMLRQNAA